MSITNKQTNKQSSKNKVKATPCRIGTDAYRHIPPHTPADYSLNAWRYPQEWEFRSLCVCLALLNDDKEELVKGCLGKKIEKMRWFSPHLYFKVNLQAKWISSSKMFSIKEYSDIPMTGFSVESQTDQLTTFLELCSQLYSNNWGFMPLLLNFENRL